MNRTALLSVLPLLLLTACGGAPITILDTTPARINAAWPAGPLLDGVPFTLNPQVQTASGRTLFEETAAVQIAATPENILSIKDNAVTCLQSGDATVTIRSGALEEKKPVSCRFVDKIVAPSSLTLLTDAEAKPIALRALGKDGRTLDTISFRLQSADPQIVDVQGQTAVGLSIGVTTLTVTAGAATATIQVNVIRQIENRTMTLNDGESVSYSLPHGDYRIQLDLRGSRQAVSITDRSGACTSPASTLHDYRCSPAAATTLLLSNPRDPGRATASGTLSVFAGGEPPPAPAGR